MKDLTGVVAISAGSTRGACMAIKSDGTLWCWGANDYGQLSDGTTTDRFTPVQVQGFTGVVAVSAGNAALAVKSDGTVWSWGRNNFGQLGDGTTTDRSTPAQVPGLTGIVAVSVSCGVGHSLAVKSDGTVWAWGDNTFGQLGRAGTGSSVPVQVSGLTGVVSVSAGSSYNLVLQAPDAPSMVGASRSTGSTDVPVNTAISWVAVPFVNYDFQLSTNANFATLIADVSNSSSTTYTPATALTQATTYYWRVRSRVITLTSAWVTSTFTTVAPPKPTSTTPTTSTTISPVITASPTVMTSTASATGSFFVGTVVIIAIVALLVGVVLTVLIIVRGRKKPVA